MSRFIHLTARTDNKQARTNTILFIFVWAVENDFNLVIGRTSRAQRIADSTPKVSRAAKSGGPKMKPSTRDAPIVIIMSFFIYSFPEPCFSGIRHTGPLDSWPSHSIARLYQAYRHITNVSNLFSEFRSKFQSAVSYWFFHTTTNVPIWGTNFSSRTSSQKLTRRVTYCSGELLLISTISPRDHPLIIAIRLLRTSTVCSVLAYALRLRRCLLLWFSLPTMGFPSPSFVGVVKNMGIDIVIITNCNVNDTFHPSLKKPGHPAW